MSVKLSAAALAHLPRGVAAPKYRRSDLSAGIVHIGVGNFHRAHQAVYLDDLFDEPLSNLDAALRVQMRVEIGELHEALKTTMIYVTHDQVEAMTMADKIVVLDRGSVAQVGSPLDLYNRPNGLFVAGFIGSPTMNLIKGTPAAKRGAETIGIRPEHADISTTAGEWPAKVRLAEHLGSDTFVHAEADGMGPLTLRLEGEAPLTPGQSIFVTPREAHLHRFDKDGRRMN